MKQKHADYKIAPYPKFRRFEAIMLRSLMGMPMMHGLIEVDVTRARTFMREHKAKTGETLSFTAFIITCLAKAVDENTSVQAYRQGRKRLCLFEDVNVNTQIERELDGQKTAIPSTVRAANRKTFREIHDEIRAAQGQDVAQAAEGMGFKAFPFLPPVLFRIGWWVLWRIGRTSPQVRTKYMGTVGITAVGMFGKGAGWGIPLTGHTLSITLGGIAEKPGVVDGQIALREYLSLTMSFDHSIVDGAPAARFIGRLKDLIESGYGLDDSTAASGLAVAPGTSNKSENRNNEGALL
jgi:pyruvate/2-oxoglutarate dehydrogenase complex dihydrolipoamide acyltransferase (E2) component